jgi:hypothetical protein
MNVATITAATAATMHAVDQDRQEIAPSTELGYAVAICSRLTERKDELDVFE